MDNSSKTYLITDTHINHSAMQEYCNRPPNFEQKIITQWQATVQPQDIVFHLGDVTWGTQDYLKEVMDQLPGTKILIRGNHDKNHSNNWFIKAGFSAVLEKAQISRVILSHFPAMMSQEEIDFGMINIHGHFHNAPASRWEKELTKRLTNNHFLLSLEEVGYKPISLEAALKGKFIKKSKKIFESENKKD